MAKLSIIVPVLNEGDRLIGFLNTLQALRVAGAELILVDGGSEDGAVEQAGVSGLVDQTLQSPRGRALQMNTGAAHAKGEWLWFLHVDTEFPGSIEGWLDSLNSPGWGFFPLKLSGADWRLRWIERAISLRSQCTRVATGDQGIFLHRSLYQRIGGMPPLPLMEDVALSKALRNVAKPMIWQDPLTTSSRRWEKQGVVRTVLLMWYLRLAYFLGVSPSRLAKIYYG